MTKKSIALFIVLIFTSTIHSQAWVKEKGKGFAQVGYSYIAGNSIYNGSFPEIELYFDVTDYTLATFFEYGLTKDITLTANIPFRMLKTESDISDDVLQLLFIPVRQGVLNAIGNVSIGMVHGLQQDREFVISAKLNIELPTATYDDETALRSGYDSFGIAPGINLGYAKNKIFSSLQTAYNFRGNDYSSQFLNAFEIGKKMGERSFLIVGHQLLLSSKNGTHDDQKTFYNGLHANDTEYLAYSLKYGFKITPEFSTWLYAAGGYYGDHVLRSPALSLSFSYEW